MASDRNLIQPHYQLHPYQRQVVHDLLELLCPPEPPRFGAGPRAIAHLPTGAGKTRVACHVACHILNRKGNDRKILIWLAASEELCEQAAYNLADAWSHLGNRQVSIQHFWGKATELDYEPGFLVTGLPKLYAASNNRQDLLINLASRAAAVIFDEAHQSVAHTYQFLTEQLLTYEPLLLGLTATPGRTATPGDPDHQLAALFKFQKVTIDPQGHPDPVTYLIKNDYLADPRFTPITLTSDLPMQRTAGDTDYSNALLNKIGADPLWQEEIARVTAEALATHRRVIVFCPSLSSVHRCAGLLTKGGHQAVAITGDTPSEERQEIITRFRNRLDNVPLTLLNYGVLTAGFDAPNTSCVVVARPTTSLVLYSQMIGRAMRGPKSGGNRRCQIYTIIDSQLPAFGSVAKAFQNWEQLWQPTGANRQTSGETTSS